MTAPGGRKRLRGRIIAGGLMLISAIVASTAYDGWRLHQQLMAAGERELGNLANALANQTSLNLQAVDVLLRDLASWYESEGRYRNAAAIESAMSSRVVAVPQTSVLSVVDAQGHQRFRSRHTGEPLADVSDRPYFKAQRERSDAGLFINEPVVTRTERLPALVMSRRLNRPDGSFDGVVTAIVTVQQLQQAYASIQLGEASALLLTLSDGSLVVREPPNGPFEPQERLRDMAALAGGPLVDRAASPVDARAKLIAAVAVRDQPLVLTIIRDEAQALAPWYDEIGSAAVRTFALAVLVILTITALLRQLRRVEQGEQALRLSEQRYAMAMEAADEGHGEWRIDSGSVFASARWCALHGVAGSGIHTFTQLARDVRLHPDDSAAVRQAVQAHLQGRSAAIEIEYRVWCGAAQPADAEAPWRWIHARGRCVRDEAGTPQRLFCAATDVTVRKTAQQQRSQLEARLQQNQRLEALGTLAGGIAHDFNNILGAILGFGEMAHHHTQPDQPIRRHLERVLQAGARARLLVRRILDFSRSGVIEPEPVHMQTVLEEVIAMLAPTLPASMAIDARLHSGGTTVLGDATQMFQVVMNLCTNGLRAMDEHGVLEIRAENTVVTQARSLFHGELRAQTYIRVDITDTGSGITADVKARMFEPFFTTGKPGEGTGLGLSVVHGIVANMGGAIDITDRAQGGTVASVWLPVYGQSQKMPPTIAATLARGHGEVVMVVDDEAPLVELAEELLAELGYEPVGYPSAEAALRAFDADPARFDAVLTDDMLPGLSGRELARHLRGRRPDLPLALMSGRIDPELEEQAQAIGIVAVLHKPLALQMLAQTMAGLCQPRSGTLPQPLPRTR